MDLSNERLQLISSVIGSAVIELLEKKQSTEIGNIIEMLHARRRSVGNTLHKGVLRDAAILLSEQNRINLNITQ